MQQLLMFSLPISKVHRKCYACKVGIKFCRYARARVSFIHGCSYPSAIVFHQTYVLSTGIADW